MLSQTNFAFSAGTPAAPDGSRNVIPQVGGTDPALFSFYSPNVGGIDPRTGTTEAILAAALGKLVTFNNGSAVGASLPHATTLDAWWWFTVKNLGAGSVTITPATSTIDGGATLVLATGEWALIFSDGSNYRSLKASAGATGATGATGPAGPAPSGTGVVRVTAGVLEDPATVAVSTDGTLASNSDLKLPTEKAVKTAIAAVAPGGSGAVTIKTNGVTNGSQALLDLLNGLGILIADDGSGHVTIKGSGFAYGGSGVDSAVTFDGTSTVLGMAPVLGVYTLTRDIFCTDCTINLNDGSGHTVDVKTNNFGVFCTGTLTVNGFLENDGTAGNNGGNSVGSGGGSGGGSVNASGANGTARYNRITAGASTAGAAGAAGQTTIGSQAAAANAGAAQTNAIDSNGVVGSTGPSGGKGGTGTSGAGGAVRTGGAGGSAPTPAVAGGHNIGAAMHGTYITPLTSVNSLYGASNSGHGGAPGGGGGGGDTTNAGGGGGGGGSEGGSASFLGIFARNIVVGASGRISCNGGKGGDGGNGRTQTVGNVGGGGGGASGPGGRGGVLFYCCQLLSNSGTIQCAGGTQGTPGTKGSPHGTGTDDATAGGTGAAGPAGVVIPLIA